MHHNNDNEKGADDVLLQKAFDLLNTNKVVLGAESADIECPCPLLAGKRCPLISSAAITMREMFAAHAV